MSRILLGAGALLGAVCIVFAVLAVTLDLSIVLFRTGSMSPTIPAGSAALTRMVNVSDVQVGDIVTVDREGALPITHRVIAVDDDGATRTLHLKGDANAEPDRTTYSVDTVRVVMTSVPGIAPVFAWVGRPIIMLPVTAAAAAVVLWAFWPRRGTGGGEQGDGPANATIPSDVPMEEAAATGTTAESAASRTIGPVGVLGLIGAVTLLLLGPAPAPAQAAPVVNVTQGKIIEVTSERDPVTATNLSPGAGVGWIVGVSANAPSPGLVDVALSAQGPVAAQLTVTVTTCSQPWTGDLCPGEVLVPERPITLIAGGWAPIETMSSVTPRWFRLVVALAPDAGTDAQGLAGSLTVRASGFGEDVVVVPPGPGVGTTGSPGSEVISGGLATTGSERVGMLAAAAVAVLGGLAVRRLAASRRLAP